MLPYYQTMQKIRSVEWLPRSTFSAVRMSESTFSVVVRSLTEWTLSAGEIQGG
jgi:hypothetical protein